ncbi:hypothetical protein [Chroococcidiopsis sp. CCNUC1]|uniref:hypothetical protein n=1 Tax=Chroococcidiopsis sp. CCNUC1 TaxID=2653189 RepID=UPI0020206417|nr:hypothetical protein [Chroococcidiopsis sp. CCNUC1]URD53456.1 hypothetical protein M5J74_30815 [Chroococcidiopsis sp. CCNUC1]
MKKTLVYVTVFALATVALTTTSYASTKIDSDNVSNIENEVQSPANRWQLVKHAFKLNVPKNINGLSQLIIDTPSTVAVSNDIDVLAQNGQKVNINVSVKDKKIIIDFPGKNISNTKLIVELNKVRQLSQGPDSVYNLWAKVVGSNTEIPVGVVRFRTY